MCGQVCSKHSLSDRSFFFEKTLSAKTTSWTWKFCYPQLRTWQPNIIFQLEGAPAHWGLNVCNFLNAEFTNHWIGKDRPTPWMTGTFSGHNPTWLFSMGLCQNPGIHISRQSHTGVRPRMNVYQKSGQNEIFFTGTPCLYYCSPP